MRKAGCMKQQRFRPGILHRLRNKYNLRSTAYSIALMDKSQFPTGQSIINSTEIHQYMWYKIIKLYSHTQLSTY